MKKLLKPLSILLIVPCVMLFSCGGKDDATPAPVATVSYSSNGVNYSPQNITVASKSNSYWISAVSNANGISLSLGGATVGTQYRNDFQVVINDSVFGLKYSIDTITISSANNGIVSGTFSATLSDSTGSSSIYIHNGVFKNVPLQ